MLGVDRIPDLLRDRVREGRCPYVSGIVLGSGEAYPLTVHRSWTETRSEVRLVPDAPTHVATLRRDGALHWASGTAYCDVESTSQGLRVQGGEGGMGDQGFIFVTRLRDDCVVWIAFFDESNPFVEVRLADGKVHALSTLDERWTFDLIQPGAITVEGADRIMKPDSP